MFSCKYCKIFKNSFVERTPPVAAFAKSFNPLHVAGIFLYLKFPGVFRECRKKTVTRNGLNREKTPEGNIIFPDANKFN